MGLTLDYEKTAVQNDKLLSKMDLSEVIFYG